MQKLEFTLGSNFSTIMEKFEMETKRVKRWNWVHRLFFSLFIISFILCLITSWAILFGVITVLFFPLAIIIFNKNEKPNLIVIYENGSEINLFVFKKNGEYQRRRQYNPALITNSTHLHLKEDIDLTYVFVDKGVVKKVGNILEEYYKIPHEN